MIFSYLTGVLSVLTPCTIVLLPIFLYRFGINRDDSKPLVKDLIWVSLGFVMGVSGVALTMNFLVVSEYSSVIRVIIGMILIILGVLHLFGKYRFSFLADKDLHPIFWGIVLPWSVSLSPCVMPIFSSFLSLSMTSGRTWLNIIFFSLGLISPAIVVSVIGNKVMQLLKKSAGFMSDFEKFSGILLVASGVYLNFQVMRLKIVDLTFIAVFFLLMVVLVILGLKKSKRLFSLGGLSFVISLIVLLSIVITNCRFNMYDFDVIEDSDGQHCDAGRNLDCPVCRRCAVLFSVSAFTGVNGYLIVEEPIKISFSENKISIKPKDEED